MADNVAITPGVGASIRTDDIAGVQWQIVKVAVGADGSADLLVPVDADTGAGSSPQLGVVPLLPAAGGPVAFPGDAANGVDVDVTRMAALVAGSALVGDVGIGKRTAGGLSVYRNVDLDEADQQIKGSAGQVYGWFIANRRAGELSVKFYNATGAAVTVGTTAPFLTVPLLQGQSSNVWFGHGIEFSTAITVACVTGVTDASTGAPGVNECVVNVFYA